MTSEIDDVIDQIYEAAVVPELWPKLLDKIAHLSQTDGGVLFTATPQGSAPDRGEPKPSIRWTASDRLAEGFMAFVREGWMERNIRSQRAFALNHAGFVTDLDLCSAEEIDTHPFYKFTRDWGLGWCAGTLIQVPTGDTLVFSWERHFAKGPVSRDIIAKLDPLRGHLARASLMASRLGLERATAAAETLAVLGLPAAVLSPRHTCLAANTLLEALIPTAVAERATGRIHLTDRKADKLFAAALAQVHLGDIAIPSRPDQNVYSIPMPAIGSHPPMVAHVIPIRGTARDIFAAAASIVIITPLSRAGVPNVNVIQGLFDLTAAEARIAKRISSGETVQEIALSSKTSEGTVRNQLKTVFAKTGVSRQGDLIGLLGNINPVRSSKS